MADQWNNTAHNVLCGIIYYVLRIYSLFAKAIRFGNQLQSSPNEERPTPKSVDKEVLRRRLRGVLISQVRAFAHVFTCPMRVVTEWPLLLTSWPLHFPYYPSSTPYLLPSTSSTPSPCFACPADVSLSAAWQLQLVRVHMNKHRLHP